MNRCIGDKYRVSYYLALLRKKGYVYRAIDRERGNNYLPKV